MNIRSSNGFFTAPRDHEGGEICRVYGEEDEREHCPDVRHEPGGVPPRAVHVDRRLEQHRPHQPQGPHQGESALRVVLKLESIFIQFCIWYLYFLNKSPALCSSNHSSPPA